MCKHMLLIKVSSSTILWITIFSFLFIGATECHLYSQAKIMHHDNNNKHNNDNNNSSTSACTSNSQSRSHSHSHSHIVVIGIVT